MFYVFAKLLMGIVLAGLSVGTAAWLRRQRTMAARLPGVGVLCAAYLLVRLATLLLVHKILHLKIPSDIPGYVDQGMQVLHGAVPLRDFASPYGFLFHYVLAAAIWIKPSPLAIMFAFQIGECLGLWLLLRAVQSRLPDRAVDRELFVLYALNPLIVVSLWLGGQDECLLILVLGVAVTLATARTNPLQSVLPALLLLTTKIFALWILAPLLRVQRLGQAMLMGIWIVVAMAAVSIISGSVPQSFRFSRDQGQDDLSSMTTSGNAWYWLEHAAHRPLGVPAAALCLLALAAAALWLYPRARGADPLRYVLVGTALCGLTYQVFYKMTFPAYLAPGIAALLALRVLGHLSWRSFLLATLAATLWPFEITFYYWIREQHALAAVARLAFVAADAATILVTAAALLQLLRDSSGMGDATAVAPVEDTSRSTGLARSPLRYLRW